MPSLEKEYIGDGAYVQYDGYSIWLTTEDGYMETHKICLEPSVLRGLLEYVEKVNELIKKEHEEKINELIKKEHEEKRRGVNRL